MSGLAEYLSDELRTLKHYANDAYADEINIIIATGDARTELQ